MLDGKRILLGITGGIAAYKSAEIASLLKKNGADVQVIMTVSAKHFLGSATLKSLTDNTVLSEMFTENKNRRVEHIDLADSADLCLIAPATANIIGKISSGIADDLLTTTVMALGCPVVFSPSMNTRMYENPIVQGNIQKLSALGYHFVEPDSGMLACGYTGKGRLPDPKIIVEYVKDILISEKKDLTGKKILITAGPTREYLDPVRYITNRSSGKMGYALAEAAKNRGAEVILISGTSAIKEITGIKTIYVETTTEMLNAVEEHFASSDILIKAAAVLDFQPAAYSDEKIKKSDSDISFHMIPSVDILKKMGSQKKNQLIIGFAAETSNFINNAVVKIKNKNLDMVVVNDVSRKDIGFDVDNNEVKLIMKDGSVITLEKDSKKNIAQAILNSIVDLLAKKNDGR